MVYCGKPSRGCQNCKNRRIKCDETQPHCQNCIKTKRTCPGYPEEVDLIFRNEIPGIRRRVKKKSNKTSITDALLAKALGDDDEEVGYPEEDALVPTNRERPRGATIDNTDRRSKTSAARKRPRQTRSLPNPNQQATLNPTIGQQAASFFFRNFIILPRNKDATRTRGYLEVALPLYDVADEASPLNLATEAVAVAVIANWPGRRHLTQLAARIYGRALVSAQRAVRDPKEATSDSTLLSIVLFAVYETLVSSDHSVLAWSKHVDGAVALVKARGVTQFGDPSSLLLFRTVRTLMLTNAVQQRKALVEFPGPKGWLSDLEGDQSESFHIIEYSVALPNVLSAASTLLGQAKDVDSTAQVESLLQQALDIERALLNWQRNMPAEWAYKTAATAIFAVEPDSVDEMEVWPGPLHTYADVNASSIRNNARVSQILCSAVILDALKWLDPESYMRDDRYRVTKGRVQGLVDDICYSVPFHLWGQDLGEKVRPDGQLKSAAEAAGGYYLIWPLYAASNVPHIPDIQKRWLRGRLWIIARYYGIEQAQIVTSLDKSRMNTADYGGKLNYSYAMPTQTGMEGVDANQSAPSVLRTAQDELDQMEVASILSDPTPPLTESPGQMILDTTVIEPLYPMEMEIVT